MTDALDKLVRDLGRLSGSAVVGVVDDEENATKLAYSEFGTHTAPPRPTLSVTTDRLTPAIERKMRREVAAVLDGKGRGVTGQEVVAGVARDLAEEVQNAVDGDTGPPLADSTKAQRRRAGQDTRTLVALGEMLRSITSKSSADPDDFRDEEAKR
jgi:hypothetical protein